MLTGDDRDDGRAADGFLFGESALSAVRSELTTFVREVVVEAGAEGAVVAMSGGVDSTLTAALAAEALGPGRVLGLAMPRRKADDVEANEARTIADGLGVEFREVPLRPLVDRFEDVVAPAIEPDGDRRAVGNLLARLRMACAYYAANTRSRLVLGTANRSELLLGYFTKYGDGAADCYPLGDLYKTEVRALAERVGLPRRIVDKEPTAGLWAGQTDAGELGAGYDVLDRLLRRLVEGGERVEDAADAVGVDVGTAEVVAAMYADGVHKRTVPPTPGVADRTDGGPAHLLQLDSAAGDLRERGRR